MQRTSTQNSRNASEAAALFAALGDQTRLMIVSRLTDGTDRSISEIAEHSTLTRQGITRHLRVLEDAGLIYARRAGRESRYRLDKAKMDQARLYLDRASKQWDHAIERLSQHLAEAPK